MQQETKLEASDTMIGLHLEHFARMFKRVFHRSSCLAIFDHVLLLLPESELAQNMKVF